MLSTACGSSANVHMPHTIELVRLYLGRDGHKVLAAVDGIEGLRLAREARPDLVVLDLMLPGLDGMEICRVLRQESEVPIVMLTTSELSLHRCPAVKARRMAIPSNSGHSAHGS